jgi:prenyltransferase beta subunit
MGRLIHWLAVMALFVALAPVAAQTQTDGAVDQAVEYIRAQQQADGSFAGLGAGSTADAVYALVAAGGDPTTEKDGNSAVSFIKAQTDEAQKPGSAAKFALALLAAGEQPTLDNGTILLDVIDGSYNEDTGRYGEDVTTHAYAVLALLAAENNVPDKAVEALRSLQRPDGGWSFDGTGDSDTNTTSLAVQALAAAGDDGDAVARAVEYYRGQQNDDGGFPSSQTSEFGTDSDTNSTALSVQALVAAGQNLDDWAENDTTPLERLLQFQNDSGAFRYNDATPEDNAFATYQAVPAVAGEVLPLKAQTGAAAPAATETAETDTTATASASASASTATAATAAPSAAATAQPSTASATARPSTASATATSAATASPSASASSTQQLPDTGVTDLLPVYALLASALLLGGGALQRRRA